MFTTVVTAKGQVVIPSKIRRELHITSGTKFCVLERNNQIVLQPLNREYFEKMAGILKTKGRLTKAILEERAEQKRLEEKKWSRF